MNSNSKLVLAALIIILLVTNVATGYMFYSRKSGIMKMEQTQILNLEYKLTVLESERNLILEKVVLLKSRIDSLKNEKSKVVSVYIDRVNAIDELLPENRDSIFINQLSAIAKTDSAIRGK